MSLYQREISLRQHQRMGKEHCHLADSENIRISPGFQPVRQCEPDKTYACGRWSPQAQSTTSSRSSSASAYTMPPRCPRRRTSRSRFRASLYSLLCGGFLVREPRHIRQCLAKAVCACQRGQALSWALEGKVCRRLARPLLVFVVSTGVSSAECSLCCA